MSVILLLLIPVLAVIASVISMKVTQAQTGQNQNTEGQAAQMTKSMNLMMPVMTALFTVTLPAGLGLYWIISSVVQILQQLILNAFLDKKGEEIVVTVPEKKQANFLYYFAKHIKFLDYLCSQRMFHYSLTTL